jgi:hypothetical protein
MAGTSAPDRHELGEVFTRLLRVDDRVAVAVSGQEGRLDAARDRLPAVEKENFHAFGSSFARHLQEVGPDLGIKVRHDPFTLPDTV